MLVQNFFDDWSDLVGLNDGSGKHGLLLPSVEGISDLRRNEVAKHDSLLILDDLVAKDLPAHVAVVLQQLPQVDLQKRVLQVLGRKLLLMLKDVLLGDPEVTDHLEGTLQVAIVVLASGVGQTQDERLVTMVLQHELAIDAALVDQVTLLLEFLIGTSSSDSSVLSGPPLFDQSHACVR